MKDVVFINDSMNNESYLKMHTTGRNEASTVVGVDESSQSPSFDLGEDIDERKEQVKENLVEFKHQEEDYYAKGVLQHLLPKNNYGEGMQSIIGIDGERQPLEEPRCLTKVHRVFG